jgi:hypothetical protein
MRVYSAIGLTFALIASSMASAEQLFLSGFGGAAPKRIAIYLDKDSVEKSTFDPKLKAYKSYMLLESLTEDGGKQLAYLVTNNDIDCVTGQRWTRLMMTFDANAKLAGQAMSRLPPVAESAKTVNAICKGEWSTLRPAPKAPILSLRTQSFAPR